jgi:tetratricopeptide (TPR) repeat protein
MIVFLDNAESILDPQGPDAREIYALVEELSRFSKISLCITSRISTVPPHFKRPVIPTLSMESASDIFYGIYENGGRSDIISDLVRRLDFHALSITLLATTALHNMWDYDRLAKEWDMRRGQVLRTDYDESLAATVELSLASSTFRKLGPEARDLLGVIAFFPQGVDEKNLDWLFPTISDRKTIFDKFCVLSLTYRSNGFITMLAPIRDYLSPPDPKSSPLLCATRDHYFNRLSIIVNPGMPGFEEARWIMSEDVNVEHLINIFTSLDTESGVVWDACTDFFGHLYWYNPRFTVLGPKIEGLPDDHPSKSKCLYHLSRLYQTAGNYVEQKRLLTHSLKLERERGSDLGVARMLGFLSGANRLLGLYAEGIQQAREAAGLLEKLGDTVGLAVCWEDLTWLLYSNNQLVAAEEAAFRTISLLPEKGEEFLLCQAHPSLGDIYRSKGERKKAIHHIRIAFGIASASRFHDQMFLIHYSLMQQLIEEGNLNDANTHIQRAKTHTGSDKYRLGIAMGGQARVLYLQGRLEDATSEASAAHEIFKELGASQDAEGSGDLLREIERARTGELLEIISLPISFNPHHAALGHFDEYSNPQQVFSLFQCLSQACYFIVASFTFSVFFESFYFVFHSQDAAGRILYRTGRKLTLTSCRPHHSLFCSPSPTKSVYPHPMSPSSLCLSFVVGHLYFF